MADTSDTLYAQYYDELLGYCRKRGMHPEDAQDLVADTFVTYLEKHDTIRDPSCSHAWLYTTLRNKIKNQIRRNTGVFLELLNEKTLSVDQQTKKNKDGKPTHVLDDLLETELSRQEQKALHFCLDKLSDDKRNTLLMHFRFDMPYRMVGERLKIAEGTVKTRMKAAIASLVACTTRFLRRHR